MSDFPDFDPNEVELTEVVEHEEAQTERSAARRAALQVLYEVDCAKHSVGDVITTRLQEPPALSKRAVRYLRRLVSGVMEHRHKLDTIIRQYAPEWPLEQVAIVDRNILRMAIFELSVQISTPVGVVIAEAVELAGLFGAEGTPRFVNGVLGALADNLDVIRKEFEPEPPEDGE
ncbi:MAG TPA: transcription antitermination factor NusB [Phototrophicaceae bacterium]|nr:transcription antitermination factor NusB [Phototrophicaceae bacterium]